MAEVEWIKLYLKTFRSSRKISAIERMKNGDTIIVVWFKLLCLAGEINDGGAVYITPKVPFDSVSLADELRKPRAVVETAIKVFVDHDMLIRDDAGFMQIINWEKYQNTDRLEELREYNRLAQRRSRERKKAKNVNENVNDKSMTSQCCQDTEEEGEEDKEKEYHSFIRSNAREEKSENEFSTDLSTMRKRLGGTLGAGVVFLSDEQMNALLDFLSLDEFDYYVGVVRDQELQGKHYKKKTHYQAILDMAKKDRKII